MKNLVEINPEPINGNETLKELINKAFTAHLSREIKERVLNVYEDENISSEYIADSNSNFDFETLLSCVRCDLNYDHRKVNIPFPAEKILQAFSLFKKWIKEDYTIFLAYSGALTPAGFGTSCLIPLIERGIVDCITTTGANVYHEIQRVIGGKFYEYDLKKEDCDIMEDDVILADEKFSRIYNIIFSERDLFLTDDFLVNEVFHFVCQKSHYLHRTITFTDFAKIAGKILEEKLSRENWLSLTHHCGIPIFCGAPQDSSIALAKAFYRLKNGNLFSFDDDQDINEMAALQYLAQKEGKVAVIILGGGVPKNFTLQGEPYLRDVCGLFGARGFDGDFQISMADVRDGGLSSCPASEGHTWGKVSEEGVGDSLYITGEVLSIFPLMVYEICRRDLRKRPKNLLERKNNALQDLEKAVKRRARPMTVHEYDKLLKN